MTRFIPRVFFLVLIAGVVASCRTAPVLNVVETPFTTKAPSIEAADKAVKRAGAALGWQMKTVDSGHILATLPIRTHIAVVDVKFNTGDFSILYKSSTNLKYEGGSIHSNYNGWVTNLRDGIIAQSALF